MMRGLRERGQSDIINSLACGVFGVPREVGGYPSPKFRVECWHQPVPIVGGIRLGPAMPPWVCTVELVGAHIQIAVRARTKGDALDAAIELLRSIRPEPKP